MSNYTDSSTSGENIQWQPFRPSGGVNPQEQDTDKADMSLNHNAFLAEGDNAMYMTPQGHFSFKDLDLVAADSTQQFGSQGHREVERVGGINREYALNYPMESPVSQNSSSHSSGSTNRPTSYYGQSGPLQLRVTNPDPSSPEPNYNHNSSGLFDPFVDASHSSHPLDPRFGEIPPTPTTPVLNSSGLHRTTHSNFSLGTATSPSRSGCSPIRHSRRDSNHEQFVTFDALTAPSHSRQHSAHLDLTPPRQQNQFGPLTPPGFSSFASFAGQSRFQVPDHNDPFVSKPGADTHGSNTFLACTSPLVPVSDRCHFNSVGAVDVRFANAAKARVFFTQFDKSRAYTTKDIEHVYGLDRFLGTPDAIDYEKTDDFYPIERVPNPDEDDDDEDVEEEDNDPGRGLKIFTTPDHPSMSLPSFDNGQPNRFPNTHAFFNDYPSHFQDLEDMEWSVFNDSTYGAPRQRPQLFFHLPSIKPTYPNSKTHGLVLVRFCHQNEREKQQKIVVFAFERDWYCQTDEILLDHSRQGRITIGPTTILFSDGNKRAEVPNVPFVWAIVEQLFLCACYPNCPYPKMIEIMRKFKVGYKLHKGTVTPNDAAMVENLHPSDMLGWELYHEPCDYHSFFIQPLMIALSFNAPLATLLLRGRMNPTEGEYYTDNAGIRQPAFERNLNLVQFMKQWFIRYRLGSSKALEPLPPPYNTVEFPPVLEEAANAGTWTQPEEIERLQVDMETFDVQGINWRSVGVRRSDARKLRDSLYFPYTNIRHYQPHEFGQTLPDTERFFRFRRIQTRFRACLAHFQLRNLVSAIDKNCIAWVGDHRVNLTDPNTRTTREVIKLVNGKDNDLSAAIRLSTMAAGYGVAVAGGFDGEYAMNGLDQPFSSQATGILTTDKEAITNYVELFQHRSSASPYAAFASNDSVMRVFDVKTNTLVSTQPYSFAVNCTATSPDGRLRLIVGDEPTTHIVDSDTGLSLRELQGHKDHGFACAWSPCGTQIATGNQDGTIQVWDTRNWRRLAVIASDVAGYRSLTFSPPGGGQRLLLAAEPADRISLIDGQTYATRQVHDFFGEIGGASFTPDGSSIVVANMDKKMGGMMWFERDAFAQGDRGLGFTKRLRREYEGDDVRDLGSLEWFGGEEGCWERGLARKRRGIGMREWGL